MRCAHCDSHNIQVQSHPIKGLPVIPFALILGGFGMMLYSIIGLILGALIGCIIGAVAKSLIPQKYETVAVCQNCGYTSEIVSQELSAIENHPLIASFDECNLIVTRNNSPTGSLIELSVEIDNAAPIYLSNNMTVYLRLENGMHKVHYEQIGGIGKKNRKGDIDLFADSGTKQYFNLTFTKTGLDVTLSWNDTNGRI